jgi:ankyrin repeat protein
VITRLSKVGLIGVGLCLWYCLPVLASGEPAKNNNKFNACMKIANSKLVACKKSINNRNKIINKRIKDCEKMNDGMNELTGRCQRMAFSKNDSCRKIIYSNSEEKNGFALIKLLSDKGEHRAIKEEVEALIAGGAGVNAQDDDGNTALMLNELTSDDALIKASADPNIKDDDGKTALLYAKNGGYYGKHSY